MNLLLDTHIWLWNDLQPEKISSQVALELASPSNDLWLSPVSIWELALLLEKKRITIPMEFHVWVAGSARDLDLREAPLPGTLLRSCDLRRWRTKILRIDSSLQLPKSLT